MTDAVEIHEAYERGRAFEREQLAYQRRQQEFQRGRVTCAWGVLLVLVAAALAIADKRGLLDPAYAALTRRD